MWVCYYPHFTDKERGRGPETLSHWLKGTEAAGGKILPWSRVSIIVRTSLSCLWRALYPSFSCIHIEDGTG